MGVAYMYKTRHACVTRVRVRRNRNPYPCPPLPVVSTRTGSQTRDIPYKELASFVVHPILILKTAGSNSIWLPALGDYGESGGKMMNILDTSSADTITLSKTK